MAWHLKTAIGLRPNRSDNRLGTSSTDSISVGVRPSPVPSPVAATSAGVEARFQPCLAPSSESTAVLRNHSAKGWLPHVPSCSKSKIKNQNSKIPQCVQASPDLYNYVLWKKQPTLPKSMNILYELNFTSRPMQTSRTVHSQFVKISVIRVKQSLSSEIKNSCKAFSLNCLLCTPSCSKLKKIFAPHDSCKNNPALSKSMKLQSSLH